MMGDGCSRFIQNRQHFTQFLFCTLHSIQLADCVFVFSIQFSFVGNGLFANLNFQFSFSIFSRLYSCIARIHYIMIYMSLYIDRYTRGLVSNSMHSRKCSQRLPSFVLFTISGLSGSVQPTINRRISCVMHAAELIQSMRRILMLRQLTNYNTELT